MFRPWVKSPSTVPCENNKFDNANAFNKHLSRDAQIILLNVYFNLIAVVSEKGALKETSRLTKVSVRTIQRIVSNGPITSPRKRAKIAFNKIDSFVMDNVVRIVHGFYANNFVPTLTDIYKKVTTSDVGFKYCRTTLWSLLKKLGFTYGRLDDRKVIMQSPRLLQLRDKYLNEIQIHRSQGKQIIYLDETWYDTHDTLKKGYRDESGKCVTNAPCSRGKRLIILHAGSENGWIPGGLLISSKSMKNSSADYHEDMDSQLFENWFRDQLLPNIPENSVIVMDNAS